MAGSLLIMAGRLAAQVLSFPGVSCRRSPGRVLLALTGSLSSPEPIPVSSRMHCFDWPGRPEIAMVSFLPKSCEPRVGAGRVCKGNPRPWFQEGAGKTLATAPSLPIGSCTRHWRASTLPRFTHPAQVHPPHPARAQGRTGGLWVRRFPHSGPRPCPASRGVVQVD